MQKFIECLATKHQVDLSVASVRLWLALPAPQRGCSSLILEANVSALCIGVLMLTNIWRVIWIWCFGWQPLELLHTGEVWAAYVQMMAATGSVQIFDETEEIRLLCFAEYSTSTL